MFTFARAITYASLFVGLLLFLVPRGILASTGLRAPARIGALEVGGILLALAGGALALGCVLAFVTYGRGTPAPFDPPRRLVVRGPYAFVRNPMYLGAAIALSGAALYYRSLPLFGYAASFLLFFHGFVLGYEEPTLARRFGPDYESYRARVGRWWPRRSRGPR